MSARINLQGQGHAEAGPKLLVQGHSDGAAFLFFVAPLTLEYPSLLLLFIFGLLGVFGIFIHTIWKALLPRLFVISAVAVAIRKLAAQV